MKMNAFLFPLAALAAAILTLPAQAQQAQCIQNDTYLVITQDRTGEVGENLLVRPAAQGKLDCLYVEQDGDYIVNTAGDPLWFEALLGKYLIMTRSTGPDGNLVVRDLETQGLLIDEWVDDDIIITDTEVTFWQRFEDGNADNCAEYDAYAADGLGAVIAREPVFDALTGGQNATGQERCSAPK